MVLAAPLQHGAESTRAFGLLHSAAETTIGHQWWPGCHWYRSVSYASTNRWPLVISLISSQSLNLGGRRGTTDDVATIPFHLFLSSAALMDSPNPIPVHSLMLSSHLYVCLPLFLAPFTVPCRIVFSMPEDLEMWPYHLSFRFCTMVKRSSCTQIAFWILLRTSSFVTRKCSEVSCSISSHGLGSFSRFLLSVSRSHRHKRR